MAKVGRLLGIVGFIWLALGLMSPFIDIPNVNILPGIILLFVARMIGRQASEAGRNRPGGGVEQKPAGRVLNTQRDRPSQPTFTPEPASRKPPPPAPLESVGPAVKSDQEKREILEEIFVSDDEAMMEEPAMPLAPEDDTDSFHSGQSLSSDEMIAQARRRWKRKY